MDILFSDKTGTITQGKLSLVEFITGAGKIVSDLDSKEFIDSITVNNLAKVSEGKAIGSNNMDRALLTYAINNGYWCWSFIHLLSNPIWRRRQTVKRS